MVAANTRFFRVKPVPTRDPRQRGTRAGLAVAGLMLCVSAWAGSQSKPPATSLTSARQKYLGKAITIKGPLESFHPGLLALYVNWHFAKRGADGRYRPVSRTDAARLPFGYERDQATIIAIQRSDDQPKGPWIDVLGNRHEASELGTYFDFVVRFDDGVIAMCTSSAERTTGNFEVITAKPSASK